MATSSDSGTTPSPLKETRESLATLFDIHRTRTNKSDFAKVELCVHEEDRGNAQYEYYGGTHCLRRLSESEKDLLKTEFVDNGDMKVISEGTQFLSIAHNEPGGLLDVPTADRILETLYDLTVDDLACIEEVVDDETRLPLGALFGVALAPTDPNLLAESEDSCRTE